jgi:hypothetical protein
VDGKRKAKKKGRERKRRIEKHEAMAIFTPGQDSEAESRINRRFQGESRATEHII